MPPKHSLLAKKRNALRRILNLIFNEVLLVFGSRIQEMHKTETQLAMEATEVNQIIRECLPSPNGEFSIVSRT